MPAIAKGARRQKSQFAGLLDLMNYLHITIYTKETREVQTLSSAEFVRPFNRLQLDLDRMSTGMIVLETLRKAIIGDEPHPEIFDLSVTALSTLNSMDDPGIEILWWYHLHLASLLGFHPQFSTCYECGKKLTQGYFSADTGQIHCDKCVIHQPGMVRLQHLEIRLLRYLLETPLTKIDSEAVRRVFPGKSSSGKEKTIQPELLTGLIVKYLQYHVEGITTLQSLNFFTNLNSNNL